MTTPTADPAGDETGADETGAGGAGADGASSRSPRRRVLFVAGVCAATATLIVVASVLVVRHHDESADHRFVIPAGTADRIAAGEAVDIIPSELHLAAGDTLTVVNEDDAQQVVGVLTVPPQSTRSYRFPHPGQYVSLCTVHRNGSIAIYVDA